MFNREPHKKYQELKKININQLNKIKIAKINYKK